MPTIFTEYKKNIDEFLRGYLLSRKNELANVNPLGPDAVNRIGDIITRGKSIRGSLLLLAYCFTHAKPSEDAIKAAASLELMQTALLIHDDIMDKDSVRRGIPTMHVQYKSESMAMCVGDVLFFMAFELLGSMKADEVTMGRVIRFIGREYQAVGVAQMADVTKNAKTKIDILNLYTYKTARYTFAVPLMLGAILAGTTKEILRYLESFGVAVGVLFQIRDDLLDHEKNPFTIADINGYERAATESLARLTIPDTSKKVLHDLMIFVLKRRT